MESLPKEKETKRRFFRRTGLSRAQRSLDSSSQPSPSHSPSLENNSIFSAASAGSHNHGGSGGIPASSSSCSFIAATSSAGGQMGGNSVGNKNKSVGNLSSRRGGGASNSLDETVIISNKMDRQHGRFMAAPRRARSAERFDGMRIAFNNSPGGSEDMAGIRSNNFHSPQLARLGNSVTDVGRPGSSGTTAAGGGSGGQTPAISTLPSPPPPYTAVTDITGPPSYRQAVAAMTASAQQQAQAAAAVAAQVRSSSSGKAHPRYSMANRSVQSFDISAGSSNYGGSLRSASSVPTFSDEVLCRCSKCQAFQRPNEMNNCGEYNDAVYMESQAFLMHEIMTDGMAFCSVM